MRSSGTSISVTVCLPACQMLGFLRSRGLSSSAAWYCGSLMHRSAAKTVPLKPTSNRRSRVEPFEADVWSCDWSCQLFWFSIYLFFLSLLRWYLLSLSISFSLFLSLSLSSSLSLSLPLSLSLYLSLSFSLSLSLSFSLSLSLSTTLCLLLLFW